MTTIEIPISRGLFATIDAEFEPIVCRHRWYAAKAGKSYYAARRTNEKLIYMHRLVMGVIDQPRTVFVDHIDFNGLNNTRANLQICTPADNARKSRTRRFFDASKGVSVVRPGSWAARIVCNGIDHYLGVYPSEREAAIAYDAAATVLFGRFAVRNFT